MKSLPEGWIKLSLPESAGKEMLFHTCVVMLSDKVLGGCGHHQPIEMTGLVYFIWNLVQLAPENQEKANSSTFSSGQERFP